MAVLTPVWFALGLVSMAHSDVGRPGMVNYIEGTVTLNGQTLSTQAVGKTEVAPRQFLETGQGRVEMLLLPGAFLRLDHNSSVEMITPSLTDTRVEVNKGQAMVEVDQLQKENHLGVVTNGVTTEIEKKGIYEFNADQPQVKVYDGEAVVQLNDHDVKVKKGRELALAQAVDEKPQSFDREAYSPLYDWSKVRSSYLAEASESAAQAFYADGWDWYGPAWYWNPWYSSWAFVPGGGFFYNPFGFGFYGPAYAFYSAPFYGYRGFYGHHGFIGHGVTAGHGVTGSRGFRASPGPGFHGNAGFGGFRAGGGLHGGGFGGGGFHGGGGRR